MPATGVLLLAFAVSIAYATFIESNQGTVAARIHIYDSLWFKLLLALVALNLAGSIFVNRLVTRKKWTIFLFHLSFIIILAGAVMTRYLGSEGTMHIREGGTSQEYITDERYVIIKVTDGQDSLTISKEIKFSERTKNRFKESLTFNGQPVRVENIQYIPLATRSIVEDENGGPVVSLLAIDKQKQRLEFILEKGEHKNFNNIVLSFDKPTDATTLLIKERNGNLVLSALKNVLSVGTMDTELTRLPNLEEFPLNEKIIYQIGHISFILTDYTPRGRTLLVHNSSNEEGRASEALKAKIKVGGQSEIIDVYGSEGIPGQPSSTTINHITVSLSYGPILRKLPFSLRLNEFQIERYPGSSSPSSLASEITLLDPVEDKKIPFRIFMNNTLKYKGYRFFQSSYDQDEKGSILLVNYDPWGTTITYIGYSLLILGMLLTLFNRNSRFQRLIRTPSKPQH